MFVDGVPSIQESLDYTNRQLHLDPIFSRGVAQLGSIHAVTFKPVVDIAQSILRGLNKLVDLSRREMLAISLMRWVGDCNGTQWLSKDCELCNASTDLRKVVFQAHRSDFA